MISRESLNQEFINLVNNYYPKAGEILDYCYVKILDFYIERAGKRFYYVGIYYPEGIGTEIRKHQDAFKEIAENMGLIEVVCINANRLIRDPMSMLKKESPRLWLDLYWVATQ